MIGRGIFVAFALATSLATSLASTASAQTFTSTAGPLQVETFASGLVNPWALAFLPDGRMLVTERGGSIRIVARDGQVSRPIAGVPEVWAQRQGGLLDVVADKSFAAEPDDLFLLTPSDADGGGRTTVARAKLDTERKGSSTQVGDHLPSGGASVVGQPFRLPHRAGRRRQSVRRRWAITSPTATRRRISATISAS